MEIIPLLQSIGWGILKGAIIILIGLVFHEFGHWLYAVRKFGRNRVRVKPFIEKWRPGVKTIVYGPIPNKHKMEFYSFGVFFGLIPIMISLFLSFGYTLMIAAYFMCCIDDVKIIKEHIKKEVEADVKKNGLFKNEKN